MPTIFKGEINGTVDSGVYQLPFKISYFKVNNISGSGVTVNITVRDGFSTVYLAPRNLALSDGDMLENNTELVLPPANFIRISSTGNVSYYFTIDNIQPE